jgi:hypothetical protein
MACVPPVRELLTFVAGLLGLRKKYQHAGGTSFGHPRPGSGELSLGGVWRRPCRSIVQKQDAPIEHPGRGQVKANVWQPCKVGLTACFREHKRTDDEFEAVHQPSREQLLDQRYASQGPQLGTVSSLQFSHKVHHVIADDFQPRPVCRLQGAREQPAWRRGRPVPSFVAYLGRKTLQHLIRSTSDEHPMRNGRVGLDPVGDIGTIVAILTSPHG